MQYSFCLYLLIGLPRKMLIQFRAENYRSLRDEQELSFVASNLEESAGKTVPILGGNKKLLCAAAIYGGNAAGKSNVLHAFGFMVNAILHSHSRWEGREGVPSQPFLFDTVSIKKPSRFEINFLVNGVRYIYGFSMDRKIVVEETLYAYPMGKQQLWFERNAARDPQFNFGKKLIGEIRTIEKLTRPNSLFLSAAAQNNHPQLSPIHEWFSDQVISFSSSHRDPRTTINNIEKKELSVTDLMKFLKFADLGVSDIELTDEDDESKKFSTEFRAAITEFFKSRGDENIAEMFSSVSPSKKIKLLHSGYSNKNFPIEFGAESHGTQTLFSLIGPIMDKIRNGGVILIDELENGMHPHLARQLVRIFNSSDTNTKNAQLIFTTHSTNLLREGELRRDQIWLTEKDLKGATHLYPLTDFKPRKSENIERGYLQGRYGAVPYLGDVGFINSKG